MFDQGTLLFLYAETPLHPGSGSASEVADLAVQREGTTGLPMIQGSALKGVLRDRVRRSLGLSGADLRSYREVAGKSPGDRTLEEADLVRRVRVLEALFGPETERASEHGGAVQVHDARLLLLPLPSLQGVFVWATCPLALHRLRRDLDLVGYSSTNLPPLPEVSDPAIALVASGQGGPVLGGRVIILEYTYTADAGQAQAVREWARWLAARALPDGHAHQYWRERLEGQRCYLVVLENDEFRELARHALPLTTRIRLDPETGTVATGALWTEEVLPPDTLLYAPLLISRPRSGEATPEEMTEEKEGRREPSAGKSLEVLIQHLRKDTTQAFLIQVGGDETTGRGLAWARFLK